MLMKWKDLEVGDVLRIKGEVFNAYKDFAGAWCEKWCNKDLVIKEIEIKANCIEIYFDDEHIDMCYKNQTIDFNGRIFWERYSGVIFDIVSLKE